MISIDLLLQSGFKETYYIEQGIDKPFYTKKLLAMHMPYINQHVVDGDYVCAEDEAVIEVTPFNTVQIVIGENYMEHGIPMNSEDGLVLLKDAGVVVK